MARSINTFLRATCVILLIATLLQLALAAPAVVPEDIAPSSSTIAPVDDTGDFGDLLESAQDTAPAIPSKLPSKDETASQINVYKTQPLTLAHAVENLLEMFGLGEQTNFILDALCLLAYAYLLRLTSRSQRYLMEIIQFAGFFLFPALPFVQLANNLSRTVSNLLHDGSSGLSHTLSCVTGHYATAVQPLGPPLSPLTEKTDIYQNTPSSTVLVRQRLTHVPPHEMESASTAKLHILRRCGGIILSGLTIIASVTTLHIHIDHPVRSDWDSVGIASDQRHGWLSGGATLASLLSVIALMTNTTWHIKPEFTRPETRAGVFGETEVFAELACAAVVQDLFAGFSGADSFAGYFAAMTANWYGLLAVGLFVAVMNKRLVCVAQQLFGSRTKSRRSSGQVSRPAVVIASLAVCAMVGGYHVFGQALAMRSAKAYTSVASGSSLSSGMESAE